MTRQRLNGQTGRVCLRYLSIYLHYLSAEATRVREVGRYCALAGRYPGNFVFEVYNAVSEGKIGMPR